MYFTLDIEKKEIQDDKEEKNLLYQVDFSVDEEFLREIGDIIMPALDATLEGQKDSVEKKTKKDIMDTFLGEYEDINIPLLSLLAMGGKKEEEEPEMDFIHLILTALSDLSEMFNYPVGREDLEEKMEEYDLDDTRGAHDQSSFTTPDKGTSFMGKEKEGKKEDNEVNED